MESKFDDENISLMNHNRIDFPLYTQLDIFKFLRAYDLQKSCINVSKEWRNTIRRYAGELPKFRDQRDHRPLVVGETVLQDNQRRSEAYYQRVECVKRKRNARYFAASATVISLLILSIISSILVLHNLHRDKEKYSRTSVSQQDQFSKRAILNEDEISGGSFSDEILALFALSMTTLFLSRYCVWLFDKYGDAPRKPYQLIIYASSRVALLCIPSFVKIPNSASGLNPSIKWSIVLLLYPFEIFFWIYLTIGGTFDNVRGRFASKKRTLSHIQKWICIICIIVFAGEKKSLSLLGSLP
ncbi:hypothetical protein Ddc_17504 [Ditylenchus destructor]|nr:hypothetical protein Ddc_17504 [Ditylenchus destructor]